MVPVSPSSFRWHLTGDLSDSRLAGIRLFFEPSWQRSWAKLYGDLNGADASFHNDLPSDGIGSKQLLLEGFFVGIPELCLAVVENLVLPTEVSLDRPIFEMFMSDHDDGVLKTSA